MSAALHHEGAPVVREIGATPRERALAVVAEIGARHHVPLREIVGGFRQAQIVRARHEAVIAIAISPAFQSWSLPMIGRLSGYRDHTTVIHILRKFSISRSGANRPAMNTSAQSRQEPRGDKPQRQEHQKQLPSVPNVKHGRKTKCRRSSPNFGNSIRNPDEAELRS